jgi:hypothetical protein
LFLFRALLAHCKVIEPAVAPGAPLNATGGSVVEVVKPPPAAGVAAVVPLRVVADTAKMFAPVALRLAAATVQLVAVTVAAVQVTGKPSKVTL